MVAPARTATEVEPTYLLIGLVIYFAGLLILYKTTWVLRVVKIGLGLVIFQAVILAIRIYIPDPHLATAGYLAIPLVLLLYHSLRVVHKLTTTLVTDLA